MTETQNLNIAKMVEGQVGAHQKFNDAMDRLDTAAATLTVLDSEPSTTPPGNPMDGATYIVPASATGAWASFTANHITEYHSGAWTSWQPANGTIAWDEKALKGLKYIRGQNKWVVQQFTDTLEPTVASFAECDSNFAIIVQWLRDLGMIAPDNALAKIVDETVSVNETNVKVIS